MTPESTNSQPSGTGSGTPTDIGREAPIVRGVENAVKALELHRSYMERDLSEVKADMRDVRDRLAKLEVRVIDLPSKIWIGTAVGSAVAFLTAAFGLFALVMRMLAH